MGNKTNINEEDYKYISIMNLNDIKKIFKESNIYSGYSLIILHKGSTYLVSQFNNNDNEIYSFAKYNGIKTKDESFDSLSSLMDKLKEIFFEDEIIVLNDMVYEDNNMYSNPVTESEILSKNLTTRSDSKYLDNMPSRYVYKTIDNMYKKTIVFILINFICSIFALISENSKPIGIYTLIVSIICICYFIHKYAYKTVILKNKIEASKFLKSKKIYNINDIEKIDDVVIYNLFSIRRLCKLYMNDNRIVKLNYYNTASDHINDITNEMTVYLREQIDNNKIKITKVEKSNKLTPFILIIIYILFLIIL